MRKGKGGFECEVKIVRGGTRGGYAERSVRAGKRGNYSKRGDGC